MNRLTFALPAVLAAVMVGAAHAQPQTPPPSPPPGMHGPGMHGPGMHQGGEFGPMLFRGSPERVARAVDHALDGIGATPEQRAQIAQIAQAAAADLKTQHEAGKALHDRALALWAAPTVDANAVESVRQQQQAAHDQASRRVQQAMLDAARVLSPEQRAKLAERIRTRQAIAADRMQRMQERAQERGVGRPGVQPR